MQLGCAQSLVLPVSKQHRCIELGCRCACRVRLSGAEKLQNCLSIKLYRSLDRKVVMIRLKGVLRPISFGG